MGNQQSQKQGKDGILFFVKYPELGMVKSRLSAKLDDTLTLLLYRAFVEDLLTMLEKIKAQILICYHPSHTLKEYKNWLGDRYQYMPQKGAFLGGRMSNCFLQGFTALDFKKLILIGSDSPDLPREIINNAFQKLEKYDTVIGPCTDGGYYLIGFTNQCLSPMVFQDIPWSTSAVYQKTMNKLKNKGVQTFILPEWRDVDTLDDLYALYLRNQDNDFQTSNTMMMVKKHLHSIK